MRPRADRFQMRPGVGDLHERRPKLLRFNSMAWLRLRRVSFEVGRCGVDFFMTPGLTVGAWWPTSMRWGRYGLMNNSGASAKGNGPTAARFWLNSSLDFTGFYRVVPGFTGFYRVLLDFIHLTLVKDDCDVA